MSVYLTLKIFCAKVYREQKLLTLILVGMVFLGLALWLGFSTYSTHISNIAKIEKLKAVVAKNLQTFEKLNAIDMAFEIENCSKENLLINETVLGEEVLTLEKNINLESVSRALGEGFTKLLAVIPNPESVIEDFENFENINITQSAGSIKIHFVSIPKTTPLDFHIILEREKSGKICKQNSRFLFSKTISLPEGWRVTSTFGRAGLGLGQFSLPYGTEYYDGLIWSSDCTNENVSFFDDRGQFIGHIGTGGTGSGSLNTPADIKIRNELLHVVEENNHRIQVFDLNGASIKTIASFDGTSIGYQGRAEFKYPLGLAISNDTIAVTDADQRILGFDLDYNLKWVSENSTGVERFKWDNPYYIEYHPLLQNFIVSNQTSSELAVIDLNGKKVRTIGRGVVSSPFELAVDDAGDILVADADLGKVFIFSKSSSFKTHEAFDFSQGSFGIPKTITSLGVNKFAVGFVGSGKAYFLVLQKNFNNEEIASSSKTIPIKTPAKQTLSNRYKTDKPGFETYVTNCMGCHETSKMGAPQRGNLADWSGYPRDRQSLLALLRAGENSFQEAGGCTECSDQDLLEAIEFLLPARWDREDQDYHITTFKTHTRN
ncbi:6-bladed beta-propeller [Alphaproteobacteria bacterium]|nr:6-bladed beta-propeller [Alphaproteobacteria bacterium]